MTLTKNATGTYEGDFRFVHFDRLHLSMRTRKKAEAEPRYAAVRRLFREAKGPAGADRRALIAQLRTGELTVERLETMVRDHEALVPTVPAAEVAAWPTVDVAMARYLDWITANPKRRRSTWNTARAQLRRFVAFEVDGVRIGSLRLDQVTSVMIEAYQRSMIEAKVPANSLTAYMSRIGALWNWTQKRENRTAIETRRVATVLHSPIDPETAARDITRRDRWLTYAEAGLLLAATPERLLFPVAAGLFGGFRIGEVLGLRPLIDIDLELGTIRIQPRKQGTEEWKPKTKRSERVVPIAPPLRPILEHHVEHFASDEWMLPSLEDPSRPFAYGTFNKHFIRIVETAGLISGRKDPRGVIFHTLRHTFASWLVMGAVDLYTVAQLLGDSLTMVEQTYAHLAPDFKRLAISKLEGLVGAVALPPPSPASPAVPKTDTGNDTESEVLS